jgi:hypothetical protein
MNTFAIVNESTRTDDAVGGELTSDILQSFANAIQMQLNRDVSPEWGGNFAVYVAPSRAEVKPTETAIILRDLSDTPGAAGYHFRLDNGAACAFVFRDGSTLTAGPSALSVTMSHEIIETWIDPGANRWADTVDASGLAFEDALEGCDAVESFWYEIDGVAVSDFLYPRFFSPGSVRADGKLSYLDKPLVAGETVGADGGDYQIKRRVTASESVVTAHVRAHGKVALHKLARKKHPWSRSSRRGVML